MNKVKRINFSYVFKFNVTLYICSIFNIILILCISFRIIILSLACVGRWEIWLGTTRVTFSFPFRFFGIMRLKKMMYDSYLIFAINILFYVFSGNVLIFLCKSKTKLTARISLSHTELQAPAHTGQSFLSMAYPPHSLQSNVNCWRSHRTPQLNVFNKWFKFFDVFIIFHQVLKFHIKKG